jgi:hypothetical protein
MAAKIRQKFVGLLRTGVHLDECTWTLALIRIRLNPGQPPHQSKSQPEDLEPGAGISP